MPDNNTIGKVSIATSSSVAASSNQSTFSSEYIASTKPIAHAAKSPSSLKSSASSLASKGNSIGCSDFRVSTNACCHAFSADLTSSGTCASAPSKNADIEFGSGLPTTVAVKNPWAAIGSKPISLADDSKYSNNSCLFITNSLLLWVKYCRPKVIMTA